MQDSKVSSLVEECVRRCTPARRVEIIEGLCTKMKTSGHTDKFIRKVILKGIKTYLAKLKRSFLKAGEPGYQPLCTVRRK